MDFKVLRETTIGVTPHQRALRVGDVVREVDLAAWGADMVRLVSSGFLEGEPVSEPEPEPEPEVLVPAKPAVLPATAPALDKGDRS